MTMAKGICIAAGVFLVLGAATLAPAVERVQLGPGGNNYVPHDALTGISVQEADLNQLLQCLIGPEVEISNAVLTAAPGAAGLFTGAAGIIGFDQGLILSSGNIVTVVGPNMLDDVSYDNAYPGDAELDSLIPGYTTYDATILEFDFTCQNPTVVSFQYVFASDEYNEWVNSDFNDVFGFFLNGSNIAVVPAVCSDAGIPVSINNVNCGDPYMPPGGLNCNCYRNNDLSDAGGTIDTEMDGLTQVFYATAQIQPGTNHMKLAIADAGDHVLDSNVMIACQSFTCAPPPETGACCFGDDCILIGQAQCIAQGGIYLGDGVGCTPNPCEEPNAVEDKSWGRIKGLFR